MQFFRNVYFPCMKAYVRRQIANCSECIMTKQKTGKQAREQHPIPPSTHPFGTVHMDHVGPILTSASGNVHIIFLIDMMTKYGIFEYVIKTKYAPTVRFLERVIGLYGARTLIINDRGMRYTSRVFVEFFTRYGIKKKVNSCQYPQVNGLVETQPDAVASIAS